MSHIKNGIKTGSLRTLNFTGLVSTPEKKSYLLIPRLNRSTMAMDRNPIEM
jgi:hypothetical protein